MGFLTNLFGGETSIWTVGFALIIVIALIVAGVWLLKVVFNVSGSMARGRHKRLALVDTMAIDNKNSLVLVKRDDVEHLILVSSVGSTLIEGGIESAQNQNISNSRTADLTPSRETPAAPMTTAGAALAGTAIAANATKNQTQLPQEKSIPEQSGLSRLLRRNPKPEEAPKEPNPAPAANFEEVAQKKETSSSVDDLRSLVNQDNAQIGPTLRHTGLLTPISEMVSVGPSSEKPTKKDNNKPSNDDSDKNEAEKIDSKAMESIEEGANSVDDAGKVKKQDGKSKSQKKGN